ncbi:leucine-rich repeat protein, partial [Verrucomicrobiales bacterium]|nr:leucine-rich repeat protein [Verrucomicrobiales bacterium]
ESVNSNQAVPDFVYSDPNSDDLFLQITKNTDPNGNGTSAFGVSGKNLIVNDILDFDFEVQNQMQITVSVSDSVEVRGSEITINLTDDREEDFDGDGLTEAQEEDVYGSSDLDVNTDGDDYNDFEEAKAGSDLNDPDSFPNEAPVISNQFFAMSESLENGSAIGVIKASDPNKDPLEFIVFPNAADPDGDGNLAFRTSGNLLIVNDSDDFDFESSPQLAVLIAVTDGDLSDVSLVFINLTDDRQEDNDGDGLSEADEEDIHNTSDESKDTDGDGYSDSVEISSGNKPDDENDFPDEGPAIAEAIDYDGTIDLINESDLNWIAQSSTSHDGIDAARSGGVSDGEISVLSTEVEGPSIVDFWWKVSSEAGFDTLAVYLDDKKVQEISGDSDWMNQFVEISAGIHSISWVYSKDASISKGKDTGWLDQVRVLPFSGKIGPMSYEIVNFGKNGATITDCDEDAVGAIEIPSSIAGVPVKKIANNAFSDCRLITSVKIPETITSIGSKAFANCILLKSIYFDGEPPTLGANVFTGLPSSARVRPKDVNNGWLSRRLSPLTTFGGLKTSYTDVDFNEGVVADGYISGSTVFIDLNGNGEFDIENEPFAITDEKGKFQLTSLQTDAPILAFGGTDTSTNTVFNAQLSAPNGSTVINPLTTVIEKMVSSGKVETYQEANEKLVEAIGIELDDDEVFDLTQYDPLQVANEEDATEEEVEEAIATAQAAIQIGSIIVTTNEIGGDAETIIEDIAAEVIDSVAQGEGVQLQETLARPEAMVALLVAATIDTDVAEIAENLAQTNGAIGNAETVEEIVNEQTVLFRDVGVEVDETAPIIYGYSVARQVEGTNSFEVTLSRPPQSDVMINVAAKQSGLFEVSSSELHYNDGNWDQPQYVTLYRAGGVPISDKVTTGITFFINDEVSSSEFRDQDPLTLSFETRIDRSSLLELNISQDDLYINLTWERGVLQSSADLKSDVWEDVLRFGIEGQMAKSPHRVRKNKGAMFFRLKE